MELYLSLRMSPNIGACSSSGWISLLFTNLRVPHSGSLLWVSGLSFTPEGLGVKVTRPQKDTALLQHSLYRNSRNSPVPLPLSGPLGQPSWSSASCTYFLVKFEGNIPILPLRRPSHQPSSTCVHARFMGYDPTELYRSSTVDLNMNILEDCLSTTSDTQMVMGDENDLLRDLDYIPGLQLQLVLMLGRVAKSRHAPSPSGHLTYRQVGSECQVLNVSALRSRGHTGTCCPECDMCHTEPDHEGPLINGTMLIMSSMKCLCFYVVKSPFWTIKMPWPAVLLFLDASSSFLASVIGHSTLLIS